jgi:hypothetical protein
MSALLHTTARRAHALFVLALAGTALISACDTDQPVAPATPSSSGAAATKPDPSVSPSNGGNLVIKVVDQNQKPIAIFPGATFAITGPNQQTWSLSDNGYYDADKTVGCLCSSPWRPAYI